jgi:hypothetical protein
VIRILSFLALAVVVAGYAFWVYSRAELPVRGSRWMATVRASVLVLILALLFDPRLPGTNQPGLSPHWVVLDASLSMSAGPQGRTPWDLAQVRAQQLVDDGWTLVSLGGDADATEAGPSGSETRLAPVLERAAESGARDVIVLSDLRIEDAPSVRAALESLPLQVEFEAMGDAISNVGVSSFDVPDAPRPGEEVVADVEVHGHGNDSVTVDVFANGAQVGSERVILPAPGLRRTVPVGITVPGEGGRVRYSARVSASTDDFQSDDEAIAYASVGYEEDALVLVSLSPNWEPRFLLPVLEDVTGLPALGYLRVGPDRFLPLGRALERAAPVDSSVVAQAVRDAELVVVHGLGGSEDPWVTSLAQRPGRTVIIPNDAIAAELVGVRAAAPRSGEWYASGDVPSSPLSGELAGASLLGLPPLSDVIVPDVRSRISAPLELQFRGTGAPEAALHLMDRADGRRVVMLASGFWRWAMREGDGHDAYRRLWSGVAGWLLADDDVAPPEPRPTAWVFNRGDAVRFSVPGDTVAYRVVVPEASVDTVLTGGMTMFGEFPPGEYSYRVDDSAGDVVSQGRFDVSAATAELVPPPATFDPVAVMAASAAPGDVGRPLRTFAWPYLLILILLCGEWVFRRRSGLR